MNSMQCVLLTRCACLFVCMPGACVIDHSTIFYFLLNFAITEAYILFRLRLRERDPTAKLPTMLQFRLSLATELLARADTLERAMLAAAASQTPSRARSQRKRKAATMVGAEEDSDSASMRGPSDVERDHHDDSDDFVAFGDLPDLLSSDSEDSVASGDMSETEDVPVVPGRATRKGAPGPPVVEGAHRLQFVSLEDGRHRCGLEGCTHRATVYCEDCDKFLCFNKSRNCYHMYHFKK